METTNTNCLQQPDVRVDYPLPIMRWQDALHLDESRGVEQIQSAYREYWPTQGELIFTGACEFQCQHCVYPPSYARLNRAIPITQWDRMLDDMAGNMGIDTFVYGGRSVTSDGVEMLANLRRRWPDAKIGLIDNGISMLKDRERLFDVRPDWVDISLDGQEADHDCQRGRNGSYRAGLDGAYWLEENQVAPKVNILACLTTLNASSIIPMILDLNQRGFRNFFVTPVTLVDGIRPAADLRLSGDAFADFFAKLRAVLDELDDAWIEINLFSVEYAEYLARFIPEIWTELEADRDSLLWHTNEGAGSSDLFVRYCPISLTGTREFIVNTNGDVIAPKSMAAGRIESRHIAGNLLVQDAVSIVDELPNSKAFEFYISEFLRERELLQRYM